jgi:hypothetical protein
MKKSELKVGTIIESRQRYHTDKGPRFELVTQVTEYGWYSLFSNKPDRFFIPNSLQSSDTFATMHEGFDLLRYYRIVKP